MRRALRSFEGKPYRDFIPPGAFMRLLPLIEDISLDWPWPYERDELKKALALLPAASRNASGKRLVRCARIYLGHAWARVAAGDRKPNPPAEARAVLIAAQDLLDALNATSDEGQRLLEMVDGPSLPPILFKLEIDRFLHARKRSPVHSIEPQSVGRGRRISDPGGALILVIRQIFAQSHAGTEKPRGFPAFRALAVTPLERLGLPALDAKSWESKEAAAARRAKPSP